MPNIKIKTALIAVYDKTGIADFARALVDEFGIEIISTGGTARHLKEAGIPVTMVEEVTGFPEMLDGRVKTLHPKIHAGILADRDKPDHMRQLAEHDIKPIDMVVVNLYPFDETIKKPDCTFDEAIEMIDIGGPCMLRAAAKNHKHVLVCENRCAYGDVLEKLRSWDDQASRVKTLLDGARDAFWTTMVYDGQVLEWLRTCVGDDRDAERVLRLTESRPLRYGENPHQKADYYDWHGELTHSRLSANVARGDREMSFNNYLDASAAQALLDDLSRASDTRAEMPCCVFLKHNNACGAGIDPDPAEAYRRAYLGDPNAAMGGILAVNFRVDVAFAKVVMDSLSRWGKDAGAGAFFLEVWLAQSFTDDSVLEFIESRKKWGRNVRLLDTGPDDVETAASRDLDIKRILGGFVVQSRDTVGLNEDQWKVVTERTPTDAEMADLRLAWLICKHTKSNAITICSGGMLIGNGAGQMSRIMSCRIATWLAKENGHAEKLAGSVAASDAFFPFRDGPDILADAGVTAIIQPGGSKRDADTIAACNERGLAMIFTGTRHFKH